MSNYGSTIFSPNNNAIQSDEMSSTTIPEKPFTDKSGPNLTSKQSLFPEISLSFDPVEPATESLPQSASIDPVTEELAWQLLQSGSGACLAQYLKRIASERGAIPISEIQILFRNLVQVSNAKDNRMHEASLHVYKHSFTGGPGRVELSYRPMQGMAERPLITVQARKDNLISIIFSDDRGRIYVDSVTGSMNSSKS